MPDPSALLSLHIGPAAHGGHCVARHEDRVVFVRHTLPGERVLAAVTARNRRYWRADAVQVLHASPDRVPSAWPAAGPGGVGGGELAHVALPAQRAWKAAVIGEQLARIARLPGAEVAVQALPGEDERGGLGYRTRIDLVAGVDGRPGMHRHRAAEVLALDSMPLAVPQLAGLGLFERRFAPGARVRAVAPGDGPPVVLVDGVPVAADGSAADVRLGRSRYVREVVGLPGVAEWRYRVSAEGFWQVHRGAAPVLVAAVVGALTGLDLAGQVVVDLYSGVGLFSLPLADLVGPSG
ncbi:MAG: SAM-dependent methyltransferase, partial [Micrococcales bacterium]